MYTECGGGTWKFHSVFVSILSIQSDDQNQSNKHKLSHSLNNIAFSSSDLVSNLALIFESTERTPENLYVSWLAAYHSAKQINLSRCSLYMALVQ